MISSSQRNLTPLTLTDLPKSSISAPASKHSTDPWKGQEPTSPTLSTASFMSSVSWMAEKSASEVVVLLKNAYTVIHLTLAAEIGRSLLDNNRILKSKYENLLDQVRQYQIEANADGGDETSSMRLISNQKAREAIIESLERKNSETQKLLDNAIQANEVMAHTNDRKTRKLEHEISLLRGNLDIAAEKIQELEEARQQLQERCRRSDEREVEQQQTEDKAMLRDLTERLTLLKSENETLMTTKRTVEERLASALRDLSALRKQFEQFEFTRKGYDSLQEAYERQFLHISELNASLEEHRHVLSRLRDRGLWSPTPSSSDYHGDARSTVSSSTLQGQRLLSTAKPSLLGELQHAWNKGLHVPMQPPMMRESRSEISSTSSRRGQSRLRPSTSFAKLRDLASMTEQNLTSFYNAPSEYAMETILATAGITDRSVLQKVARLLEEDEDDSLYDEDEDVDLFGPDRTSSVYGSHDLYPCIPNILSKCSGSPSSSAEQPSQGVIGQIIQSLRSLFRAVFRWCRFAVILAAAVMINLGQGPDAMLEK
ncbi:hypothetical protein EC973_002063 [Apophysomyces ossiformis]|uniref:Uncharacterized protein n=1 Tax=Apophysomyces ossiformis TaxID=679940 RepID=A0A8H7BP53_9FUNG|nr:hypothetical protein EC973_002063 [Apophysomyces ossiformis]